MHDEMRRASAVDQPREGDRGRDLGGCRRRKLQLPPSADRRLQEVIAECFDRVAGGNSHRRKDEDGATKRREEEMK